MSRIVTFYSYKGGVGRTLALANIGVLLAKRGKRVLFIDWDLEAPGLDRYFKPYLKTEWLSNKGTIYLLNEALSNPDADWRHHVQQISVQAENTDSKDTYTISIIPSGVASTDYARQVRAFSWAAFMEKDGGPILERWRDEWKKDFDYVLLDSRTGITDTGGICTILLPDFLALVFTANDQSFGGALSILQSAQAERKNLLVQRPPLMILPLLSRFDRRAEVSIADKWMSRFASDLKPAYDDWLPTRFKPMQILELTKVPYVTTFSFGEPLPVLTHSLTDPELPGYYLENAARLIATDFGEAAQIINPNEEPPESTETKLLALVRRGSIDEAEMYGLIRQYESEMGAGVGMAVLLSRVALALDEQARYISAEPLMRRALEISERSFGLEHSNVAVALCNLASLLQATNRLKEAELLLRRALGINEKSFGPNHPDVAATLCNLASLFQATNRLKEAEPLLRRALDINEKSFGPDHPNVALTFSNLASLLQATNRLKEAEPLARRALEISEKNFGPDHPNVAATFNNLASLLQATNRSKEAEPLLRRALEIIEKSLGPEHPDVAAALNNLAGLLQATDRLKEAEPLLRRALKIDENSYGPDHPDVAMRLNNLATLLQDTNRLNEAEPLIRRALEINENSYGPKHPRVATALNNLASLLQASDRLKEAEPLARRALEINEGSYGSQHPQVAVVLNNLAKLLQATNRLKEAEPLMYRHLVIFLKFVQASGHKHPHLDAALGNYYNLLQQLLVSPNQIQKRIGDAFKDAGFDSRDIEELQKAMRAKPE